MKTQIALLSLLVLGVALFGCTQSSYQSASPTPVPTMNAAGYQASATPTLEDPDASDFQLGDVDDSDLDYAG